MEDFFELLIAELEQYLTEDECAYPVRVLLNNDEGMPQQLRLFLWLCVPWP